MVALLSSSPAFPQDKTMPYVDSGLGTMRDMWNRPEPNLGLGTKLSRAQPTDGGARNECLCYMPLKLCACL